MSIEPLTLAPFEHFMLADDTPDHLMSFFIQLKFQARLDRSQLNAALKTALTLHSLLNSQPHGSVEDATSEVATHRHRGDGLLVGSRCRNQHIDRSTSKTMLLNPAKDNEEPETGGES